ncbi:hypothetical protein L484_008439 [Morus notabilis]|uniref:CRM domain-containing protein n=1 Tax=Morus notabilis TaxID=981085 RepID=W9SS89_9ROSA|nr:hypothetical protein L484_008439 [Morus notabilis]
MARVVKRVVPGRHCTSDPKPVTGLGRGWHGLAQCRTVPSPGPRRNAQARPRPVTLTSSIKLFDNDSHAFFFAAMDESHCCSLRVYEVEDADDQATLQPGKIENEAELEEEEEEEEEAEDEDEYDDDDDSEAREVKMIEDFDEEEENGGEKESEKMDNVGLHSLRVKTTGMQLPSLTVKEKKELASYAHSLGKKLKSQLVGKSGVTSNVATSFVETLESNELLKIKIHRTCPGELDDVVKQLEELTGSVVVGKIGRTVIIYRPSLTKLKAEEKKQQFQKILMRRKQLRARPAFPVKKPRR